MQCHGHLERKNGKTYVKFVDNFKLKCKVPVDKPNKAKDEVLLKKKKNQRGQYTNYAHSQVSL